VILESSLESNAAKFVVVQLSPQIYANTAEQHPFKLEATVS
jgi:hypothetical protein